MDTHSEPPDYEPAGIDAARAMRPWEDLRTSGLLWLINRVVFHPRGWALGLVRREGEIIGWRLLGDGREVWRFDGDEDANFANAQAILRERAEGDHG